MKKFMCCFGLFILIAVIALSLPKTEDYDYLRIHIRANSNSQIDQSVKYKVKDSIVDYLTPWLCSVKTKQQAIEVVNKEKVNMQNIGKKVLKENGILAFEIGYDQGDSVSNIMKNNGYIDIKVVKDLAGLDRVVIGRFSP